VFDTDILSIHQRGEGPAYTRLCERIAASGEEVFVTIVSFEEQVRGWLEACKKATTPELYTRATNRLNEIRLDFADRAVLLFGDVAATEFARLKQLKVRIGTMDLRIAAITLAHSATLITRNRRDFEKVPGLNFADWTV